jgi:predicted aldo/keto reductase-like oxidoreductase
MEKQDKINRRRFLKGIGAAGLGSAFIGTKGKLLLAEEKTDPNTAEKPQQETPSPQVPKRNLGKTGVEVSCLGIGTMFNLVDNQIILKSAIKYGVTYWDTANSYAGGNSELGIGKYLEKEPNIRKDLFIVTKASRARTTAEIEQRLQESLERMNTDYIDAYFTHGISDPAQLTDELRQWVESAKKRKLIRYFGFSTHSNMAQMLTAAAKLGWVDMIMTTYNFRLLNDAEMQAAIDTCHKAKIGLVAMKTAGRAIHSRRGQANITGADKKLMEQLLERSFTQEQAAIKLVLQDERISCACVGMETVPILTANVAAVLDKTEITQTDRKVFNEYAKATCTGYCAGCAHICNSALPDVPHVSDIMRYLMYHNSYGDKARARELFAQIPSEVRGKLLRIDYTPAEAKCPQHLPIGKFISEAVKKLS